LVPYNNCRLVPYNNCRLVPYNNCRLVPYNNCRLVPYNNCRLVPYNNCRLVPYNNCRLVPYNNPQPQLSHLSFSSDLTAEVRCLSQANPCGAFGGHCDAETGFAVTIVVLPVRVIAPVVRYHIPYIC